MKKLTAILLALLMVVSMIPMFAFSISANTPVVNGGAGSDSETVVFGNDSTKITESYNKYLTALADTSVTEYAISTPYDLLAYSQLIVNNKMTSNPTSTHSGFYGTFYLTNDIVLNSSANPNWLGAASDASKITVWSSKGEANNHSSFNGNGFTISGIYLAAPDAAGASLFGRLHTPAANTIRFENVSIVDSYVVLPDYSTLTATFTASKSVSFGCIYGNILNAKGVNISNVYLDIDITPPADVELTEEQKRDIWGIGGIIGWMRSPGEVTIDSCVVAGDLNTGDVQRLGGFIGFIEGTVQNTIGSVTIKNSAFYGTLTSKSEVAGYVGRISGFNPSGTQLFALKLENCITAAEHMAGGSESAFYGVARKANSGADAMTEVVADTCYVKDCLYTNATEAQTKPTNFTFSTKQITADDLEVRGEATLADNTTFTSWTAVSDSKVYPTYIANNFASEISTTEANLLVNGDRDWYALDSSSEFTITSGAEFVGFAKLIASNINFKNKTVKLANDIVVNADLAAKVNAGDLSGVVDHPISKEADFFGTFDGQNHTVSGLYKTATIAGFGFFGACRGGTTVIKNLGIVDSYIDIAMTATSGNCNMGGLIGSVINASDVTLENLYVDIDFISSLAENTALTGIGGLIGFHRQAAIRINNVVVISDIEGTGTLRTGGFIGFMSDSTNAAHIVQNTTITDSAFYGTIINETNFDVGETKYRSNVGGFVGFVGSGTLSIDNCVSDPVSLVATANAGAFYGIDASTTNTLTITNSAHTTKAGIDGAVKVSSVKGKNNADFAIQLGRITGWITLDNANMIPAGVAPIIGVTGEVASVELVDDTRFAGFQVSENVGVLDGKYSIRFIGVIDKLDYSAVGFKITSESRQGDGGGECITVYNSLYSMDGENEIEHTAASFNAEYIFAGIVEGFGADEVVEITVQTYHKPAGGGEAVVDTTYTFTINMPELLGTAA